MKRGKRLSIRRSPPVTRTAFAIFAVLLNTIFTASLSLAASVTDPLRGDYVICPATGGLMPATPAPSTPDKSGLHCPLCRLPTPIAVHIPLPGDASVPNRIVFPMRYAAAPASTYSFQAASVFEARAPPR